MPVGILPVDHGIVSVEEAYLEQLEAALKCPEAEAWVRARAPRLEGNDFSLTTTLLRDMPLNLSEVGGAG